MNLIEASKNGTATELFAYLPYVQSGVFSLVAIFLGLLTILAVLRARMKRRALQRDPRRLDD